MNVSVSLRKTQLVEKKKTTLCHLSLRGMIQKRLSETMDQDEGSYCIASYPPTSRI